MSQNEARTKDQTTIESYRQNCGQAHGQSAAMTGSSFSAPLSALSDLNPTVASIDSPAFMNDETLTRKAVNLRAVNKQDAGLVGAARNQDLSDEMVYGDVTISCSAMEVHRAGKLVALTLKEFKTLAYLLKNARRVISRDELLNEVWGIPVLSAHSHGRQPHFAPAQETGARTGPSQTPSNGTWDRIQVLAVDKAYNFLPLPSAR